MRSISLPRFVLIAGLISVLLLAATAWADKPAAAPTPSPPTAPAPADVHQPVHEYWLGVMCTPLQEALRAQLKVPNQAGLLVEQVLPNSPAAGAKIERFDVIAKAGGKTMKMPLDLVEAVRASDGKKISLEVIRGGKPMPI